MRILLCHNFYRSSSPSGEDAVFRNERTLLQNHGAEVISFERFNDKLSDSDIGEKVKAAINGIWSKEAYRSLAELISKKKPDLAHFHNTFPQISSSAYMACKDYGVPVVQTLHNFRLHCPGALLMREGKPCEKCIGVFPWPSLRYRCYRNSLLATGAQVMSIFRNRLTRTYKYKIDQYIALTIFAAERLVAGGLPAAKLEVRPNFLPDPPEMGEGDGNFAVFVGRLSVEKGIRGLVRAWAHVPDLPLKILGDGPLRQELERQVNQQRLNVKLLGYCSRDQVLQNIGKALMVVIPSECYEGFPIAVLEAYACGTPVIATRIGSMDEIVIEGRTGLKFKLGDVQDLASKVKILMNDKALRQKLRYGARSEFEEKYTAEISFKRIMHIYSKVLRKRANQGTKLFFKNFY